MKVQRVDADPSQRLGELLEITCFVRCIQAIGTRVQELEFMTRRSRMPSRIFAQMTFHSTDQSVPQGDEASELDRVDRTQRLPQAFFLQRIRDPVGEGIGKRGRE